MSAASISVHDELPPHESALVDEGIGKANDAAAPLHEVVPLACFARSDTNQVIGGAIGRRWGTCCELQQLWVEPTQRHQGIATQLMAAFEARAQSHGCTHFYLETFSFQAPALYRSLGYTVANALEVFPHGIVKYLMIKHTPSS
jgi:ribosomal protein S18 acetylase RimI-like enzyme